MELWLVGLLALVAVVSLVAAFVMRHKSKKPWMTAVIIIASLLLTASIVYLALTLLFLNAI